MNTATRTAIEVLAPVIREATKDAVSDNTGGRAMRGVDASRVAAAVTQEVTAVVVNRPTRSPGIAPT